MNLWHAPTGRVLRGHVLDVSLKPFEQALKDHDRQLYVRWNPLKLKGWGCWEIRRLPNQKRAVYMGSHQGAKFFKVMYVEQQDVHHVLDCAFLNYDAIRKIKEMDIFRLVEQSGYGNLNDLLDAKASEAEELKKAKAVENLRLHIRDNRTAMRDIFEAVRSGTHPAQILKSIKWVNPT